MNVLLLDNQRPEQEQPATVLPRITPTTKRFICSRRKVTTTSLALFGFAFAVVLGMILANVANTPLTGPVASRPTFMVIGDSITQYGGGLDGWASRLQANYIRSVDVINRGLSGYSTRSFVELGLPVVSRELETSFAPDLITLWFGANDAALADGPNANQHVPLDEYRSNLVKIVNEFRRVAPQARILLMSPPVVDDAERRRRQVEGGGKSDPIDRDNAQAGLYAMACGAVVQTLDVGDGRVSFLDVHSYMMTAYENATSRAALLSDGLHLSTEGNRVIFEQVKSRVELLVSKDKLDTPQIPVV